MQAVRQPCLVFDVVDFGKFGSKVDFYGLGHSGVPVRYWRCSNCDFLFTDVFDGWFSRDWSRLIYNAGAASAAPASSVYARQGKLSICKPIRWCIFSPADTWRDAACKSAPRD